MPAIRTHNRPASPPPSVERARRTAALAVAAGLAAVLSTGAPVSAGVVFEIEVKDHRRSPPRAQTVEIAVEGRFLKMDLASRERGEPDTLIFRGTRPEMVFVDHDGQSFMTVEQETVDRVGRQAEETERQVREAIQSVHQSRRAAVEQAMKRSLERSKAAPRPERTVKALDERTLENGYPCVKFEVHLEGRKIRELWVTEWSKITGGDEVRATFEDMGTFFTGMVEAITSLGHVKSPLEELAFEHLAELGGFPVVIRELDAEDGSLEAEWILDTVRRRTLDPDSFKDPSDYSPKEVFAAAR
ncbi:MAG: hypothetical protein AAGF23_17545 [Acidobacteriota bacterium]